MVVEHLQLLPLFAQINSENRTQIKHLNSGIIQSNVARFLNSPNICAGDGQVITALIEAKILNLIAIVQLDCLEVFQFTQIPQFHARIIGSGSQIVTVLGE